MPAMLAEVVRSESKAVVIVGTTGKKDESGKQKKKVLDKILETDETTDDNDFKGFNY
jgi:hypothetical protein